MKKKQSTSSTLWTLLAGNFAIGTGVLAPAGLMNDLMQAFSVDAATAGTLIAYGGALLCIEAPILAYVTNRMDRRYLLAGALFLYALGHGWSALVTDFQSLLTLRLIMIAAVAGFTPQAASALPLFIVREKRAEAITFIFLGWSLAGAIGIPFTNLIGSVVGWQIAYFILAGLSALAGIAVFLTMPVGLRPHHLSTSAWHKVLSSANIWGILCISGVAITGQYMQYPYIVVELNSRVQASPFTMATLLAAYGSASILGTVSATRTVQRLGVRATVTAFLAITLLGLILWTVKLSFPPLIGLTLFIWGIGMSPAIAAQQARLIETDPLAASASTALNTSIVYLGQAVGTSAGGMMLTRGLTGFSAGLAIGLLTLACILSLLLHLQLRV
ncbi:MFS transporter [Desulfobulbus oligotrophicus]|uniref:MFS transporter n=1 Tax=Desulfobulbus oligotrophicus TaxID=1909699 RepID=A0A7T5VEZ8_9BACT|nr:MFS transporter [Desulfobulbus oligotrophicus]QQG66715.1 MFS transporter [Desulfobulbus oligotrophicus]